jgi:hypothetical protein
MEEKTIKPTTKPVSMKYGRKIIQIAVAECMAYDNDCGDLEQSETIVALCNDGTLWRRWLNSVGTNRNEPKWVKIENVPQD